MQQKDVSLGRPEHNKAGTQCTLEVAPKVDGPIQGWGGPQAHVGKSLLLVSVPDTITETMSEQRGFACRCYCSVQCPCMFFLLILCLCAGSHKRFHRCGSALGQDDGEACVELWRWEEPGPQQSGAVQRQPVSPEFSACLFPGKQENLRF